MHQSLRVLGLLLWSFIFCLTSITLGHVCLRTLSRNRKTEKSTPYVHVDKIQRSFNKGFVGCFFRNPDGLSISFSKFNKRTWQKVREAPGLSIGMVTRCPWTSQKENPHGWVCINVRRRCFIASIIFSKESELPPPQLYTTVRKRYPHPLRGLPLYLINYH